MLYLLDTNILSDLMSADPAVEGWLSRLNKDDKAITCTIVRGEVLFGIARLPEGKRRSELERTAEKFVGAFECAQIPVEAGDFYAVLKRSRQRSGMTLDENDLWIAATALALGASLVSRDSDFAGIEGLAVVAPE